jgi:hypothetical protein
LLFFGLPRGAAVGRSRQVRNVFERAPNGAMVSRRMVKDRARDERERANGKGGGNPDLVAWDNPGVNPPVNGRVNRGDNGGDKAQKLESRIQSPESKKEGARARASYSVAFEDRFWKPYPRTSVMSKADAWRETSEEERGKSWAVGNLQTTGDLQDAAYGEHFNPRLEAFGGTKPVGEIAMISASHVMRCAEARQPHAAIGRAPQGGLTGRKQLAFPSAGATIHTYMSACHHR